MSDSDRLKSLAKRIYDIAQPMEGRVPFGDLVSVGDALVEIARRPSHEGARLRSLLREAADALDFWAEGATGDDKTETEDLIERIGNALSAPSPDHAGELAKALEQIKAMAREPDSAVDAAIAGQTSEPEWNRTEGETAAYNVCAKIAADALASFSRSRGNE